MRRKAKLPGAAGGGWQQGSLPLEEESGLGPPALPCHRTALKWNLAWGRGEAERRMGAGKQRREQTISSYAVPGQPVGWAHNCQSPILRACFSGAAAQHWPQES